MMLKGFGASKAAICLLPKRFDTTKTQSGPSAQPRLRQIQRRFHSGAERRILFTYVKVLRWTWPPDEPLLIDSFVTSLLNHVVCLAARENGYVVSHHLSRCVPDHGGRRRSDPRTPSRADRRHTGH